MAYAGTDITEVRIHFIKPVEAKFTINPVCINVPCSFKGGDAMKRKLTFLWICIVAVLASPFVMVGLLHAVTTPLDDIPGTPGGSYRWLDAADQAYGETYQSSYNYTQANVEVVYDALGSTLRGTLTAVNLKPNFAYQIKLAGNPGMDAEANERIGLAGRWWQEEWDGSTWTNGQNLNDKGDGSSPSPNDDAYSARRDIPDASSPSGLHYRFTGYLVPDYFITDENGNTTLEFEISSSFHVLWKTTQRTRTPSDGPLKTTTFDVDPLLSSAYDTRYDEAIVSIFGEWERLPVGGIFLQPGSYTAQIVLTEESFHGSGGSLSGNWAAAMAAGIQFCITNPSDFDIDGDTDGADLAVLATDFGRTDCDAGSSCNGDFDGDGEVDGKDLAVFAADFGQTDCP